MALLNLSTSAQYAVQLAIVQAGLAQLEQMGPSRTHESLQLEWDLLGLYSRIFAMGGDHSLKGEENSRITARLKELEENPSVTKDPITLYCNQLPRMMETIGSQAYVFNDGHMVTADDVYEHLVLARNEWQPLLRQARDQCVGARWEFQDSLKNTQMIQCSMHQCCHTTRRNAESMHAFAAEEWGEDFSDCVKSMTSQNFKRHCRIAQKSAFLHNQMPVWGPNAYLAEKDGRLEHFIDVFSSQRRYLEAYIPTVRQMSADESWEAMHWSMHAPLAGEELAHLHPFRDKLLRAWKLAGFKDVQEFGELFDQWPCLAGLRAPGQLCLSADGLVHEYPLVNTVALVFAMLALASPDLVDLGYIETLPAPDAPPFFCVIISNHGYASSRVMIGEVLEQHERWAESINWAQAELEEPKNRNPASQSRAGRLLGRAHAALGEPKLAMAAVDAALETTKTALLRFSESLTVRARVLLGVEAVVGTEANSGSSSPQWTGNAGKQRLSEVMGRMDGDKRLHEKLLLHGLARE